MTRRAGRPAGKLRVAAGCAAMALAACGGGAVSDPPLSGTQVLAFAYFQQCVNPVFLKPLTVSGSPTPLTCSAAACHNNASGAGGSFRIIPSAQNIDLSNPANTPDVIRSSDMFKNFTSAQGETVTGSPTQSLLVNKPLVRGVTHGGGQVFADSQDANLKLIEYWVGNPVPQGQDEFSTTIYSTMFSPPFNPSSPNSSACNS